jgi:signal transduction histidine kinase
MAGLERALDQPGADLPSAIRAALSRGEHLDATIDDLISLLQPRTAPVPVCLADLAGEVASRWQPLLTARGRRLFTNADPDLPGCLAPSAALRQILDVLIANALWHGEGTVKLVMRQGDGGVLIEVSDEGPGFAEQPVALLTGSAEKADGHGRGLPLARSLAEAAGGSFAVRRAAPQPVFSMLFPAEAQPTGRHATLSASKR